VRSEIGVYHRNLSRKQKGSEASIKVPDEGCGSSEPTTHKDLIISADISKGDRTMKTAKTVDELKGILTSNIKLSSKLTPDVTKTFLDSVRYRMVVWLTCSTLPYKTYFWKMNLLSC
jgi:hypothetical protein